MLDSIVSLLEEYGLWGLILLTFLDSFISPFPPEILLIPMSLLNPSHALWYALVTTVFSVLGATVGYWLGVKGGRPLLRKLFCAERIAKAELLMARHDVMAVLLISFTPIPYKLITVTSGVLNLSFKKLIIWSTVGRGARFFLEAFIITAFGQGAGQFIQGAHFAILTLVIGVIVIGLYVFISYRRCRK